MLEALLAGGGGGFYPNSGPGPKKLISGNEELGYFGTVSEDVLDFPTETILDAIIEATPNSDFIPRKNALWNKYFFKKKVLYYPVSYIASGRMAMSITRAGMRDGNDLTFKWTEASYYSPFEAKQDFRLFVKDNQDLKALKVRCLQTLTDKNTNLPDAETSLFTQTHFKNIDNIVNTSPQFVQGKIELGESESTMIARVYPSGTPVLTVSTFLSVVINTKSVISVGNIAASQVRNFVNYYRPVLELDTELDPTFKKLFPVSRLEAKPDTSFNMQQFDVSNSDILEEISALSVSPDSKISQQGIFIESVTPSMAPITNNLGKILINESSNILSLPEPLVSGVSDRVVDTGVKNNDILSSDDIILVAAVGSAYIQKTSSGLDKPD